MKDQILQLHNQGKSYREIQKILKCSRSLISYYVNPSGKTSNLNRQNKNRFVRRTKYKNLLGGKCHICGYNKCLNALQFHHIDPTNKKFQISDSIWGVGKLKEQEIIDEVNKCILVCANCHCEIHFKNEFIS